MRKDPVNFPGTKLLEAQCKTRRKLLSKEYHPRVNRKIKKPPRPLFAIDPANLTSCSLDLRTLTYAA